mgnify:CR=1 FL=1
MGIIIKNFNKEWLITAILFTLASSCGKDNGSKPCRGGRYSFVATSEFSPQRERYNVGDTIFLNSTISKTLYDNVSLQNVDYSNSLGIGGNFSAVIMDTISQQVLGGLNNFEILNIIGSTSPTIIH